MPTKKSIVKKTANTKKAVNKVNARKGREGALGQKTTAKKVVKKPTAKKVVRKTATKKPTAMKKPVKDLVYASDQESFWTTDGSVLNSLTALRDAFSEMESAVFKYHAQGEQNDFATWVEGVLCDGDCAQDLQKAKTAKGAKTAVNKHLKLYSI